VTVFAWIRYKVKAQVVEKLEITEETRKWADKAYGRGQNGNEADS
jgi:hypothetical protein